MRAWEWVLVHWPTSWRRRIAYAVAIVVFVLAALPLLFRIAGHTVDFGSIPYISLFILCWVGEGGLVVPIPGVRLLSWLTIIQQGAYLEPVAVALVAAAAMACGQSSYFLGVRSGSKRVLDHLDAGPLKGQISMLGAADSALAETPAAEPMAPSETSSSGRLASAAGSIALRIRAMPRRTVFLVSVIPSPLTTLTTVAAASAGVRFRDFFLAGLAGFLVFSSVLAFAGQAILSLIGHA